MVSDLENKQKTVLGVALPEDSKSCSPTGPELYATSRTWVKGGEDRADVAVDGLYCTH